MRRYYPIVTAAAAAVVLVALPLTTLAGDFCLDINNGAIVVGQRFRVPGAGKCKAFIGFSQNDPTTLVNGDACATSDGAHVRFNLTTSNTIENLNVTLDLPGLTGTATDCTGGPAFCNDYPAVVIPWSESGARRVGPAVVHRRPRRTVASSRRRLGPSVPGDFTPGW